MRSILKSMKLQTKLLQNLRIRYKHWSVSWLR
uniref:Uncharacterized protein n=1 Tax=Rhizophora mucronata TaxID=61149 RepID=A0A2P2MZU2_RHIMU